MKGIQISFRDIMPSEQYNNIFTGISESSLLDSIRKIASFYTDKALLELKDDLKMHTISSLLKKFYLPEVERKQLSKKYEPQVKETLLQILYNKKFKNSIHSKVNHAVTFNQYITSSFYDFKDIVDDEDFYYELNELVHKIIIEELSLRIKKTAYYKKCMTRYQNVTIEKIKNYVIRLLKYAGGRLTLNDYIKIFMWIVDKIKDITTNRVGKTCSFYFVKK